MDKEEIIFEKFSRLQYFQRQSFELRQPPKPDILFTFNDGKKLAFELVEIVDENLMQWIGIQKLLQEYYLELFQDTAHFQNALIAIDFAYGLTVSERKNLSSTIVSHVVGLPATFSDDVAIPAQIRNKVQRISITRGDFPPGPFIQIAAVGGIGDPLQEQLIQKFQKKYQTPHDIHLLAYYNTVPSFHEFTESIHLVEQFVNTNIHQSQFKRVWIFDANKEVLLNTTIPSL